MEYFEYKDIKYKKMNGIWYDNKNMKVCKALQSELNCNHEVEVKEDIDNMNSSELIELADEYKGANRFSKALDIYNKLLMFNDIDITKTIASKVTSCYRNRGESDKAIELYNMLKGKYGEKILSSALLTSVAGAYMDNDDYYEAKKLANKAYAKLGGKPSLELVNVYNKLNNYFK